MPAISWHAAADRPPDPHRLSHRLSRGAQWGATFFFALPAILLFIGLKKTSRSFDRYCAGQSPALSLAAKSCFTAISAMLLWQASWETRWLLLLTLATYLLATFHKRT